MRSFKEIKEELINDYFLISDGDISEAAAFSTGLDVFSHYHYREIRALENQIEKLRDCVRDLLKDKLTAEKRAIKLLKETNGNTRRNAKRHCKPQQAGETPVLSQGTKEA